MQSRQEDQDGRFTPQTRWGSVAVVEAGAPVGSRLRGDGGRPDSRTRRAVRTSSSSTRIASTAAGARTRMRALSPTSTSVVRSPSTSRSTRTPPAAGKPPTVTSQAVRWVSAMTTTRSRASRSAGTTPSLAAGSSRHRTRPWSVCSSPSGRSWHGSLGDRDLVSAIYGGPAGPGNWPPSPPSAPRQILTHLPSGSSAASCRSPTATSLCRTASATHFVLKERLGEPALSLPSTPTKAGSRDPPRIDISASVTRAVPTQATFPRTRARESDLARWSRGSRRKREHVAACRGCGRVQEAPNAYCQNSRMSGVGVGPVICTCVRRMPMVPLEGAMWAVVPVPPIQP